MNFIHLKSARTVITSGFKVVSSGCFSFEQDQDDVYRREAGGTLQPWLNLETAAAIHWPYAWASVAAYQDSDDSKRKPLVTSATCPEPHIFLGQRGWVQWTDLPSLKPKTNEAYSEAARVMREVHLRAEVWSNEATEQVIVSFGGTAATSLDDWRANLRWILFNFESRDQYTVLTDTFLPTFIDAYHIRKAQPEWAWLDKAQVISTGHSLGGGLAQRFAYSLRKSSGIPIVKEVFAFDPSPVSGKLSSPDYRKQADGLTIYRIYNRGEILATLRSLVHFGNRGDRRNQGQKWIDIRYQENWSWRMLLPTGAVHVHGMYDLAKFMARNLPSEHQSACTNSV